MNCSACHTSIPKGYEVFLNHKPYHADCAVIVAQRKDDEQPVNGSRGSAQGDEGRTLDTPNALVH